MHYKVLMQADIERTPDGFQPRSVVLCEIDNPNHPYVTWIRNDPERGGDGAVHHGNYYETYGVAAVDFVLRVFEKGAIVRENVDVA